MHKIIDFSFVSLNAAFGLLALDATNVDKWNINIIVAVAGLFWVVIERLPKAVYFINKAILGIKATWKGEKLNKEDFLDSEKNSSDEN